MTAGDGVQRDDVPATIRADPTLGRLVERYGPKQLTPADDFFKRFVQSILRQQISMAAADTIFERLRTEIRIDPESIAHTDEATLTGCGLSQRKATTIRAVAEAFQSRGWSRSYFSGVDDAAVVNELTTVSGVGVWTAKMQLLFSLARQDVFPVEDLGVRQSMQQLYADEMTRAEMYSTAEAWRPYRSLATLYLWEVVDD